MQIEATAAINRQTEQLTLQIINELKQNCVVLFISHRLQSLPKFADEIYILEKSSITHHSSHQQLLTTANFYSDYFQVNF